MGWEMFSLSACIHVLLLNEAKLSLTLIAKIIFV